MIIQWTLSCHQCKYWGHSVWWLTHTNIPAYRPTDLQTYRHMFCFVFLFCAPAFFWFFLRVCGALWARNCSTSKYYHIKFHIIPSSRLAVLCDFRLVTQTDIPTYQHTNIPTYRHTYIPTDQQTGALIGRSEISSPHVKKTRTWTLDVDQGERSETW